MALNGLFCADVSLLISVIYCSSVDVQGMDDDAVKSIRSSVSIIERTLYKLMLDVSEHVQVTIFHYCRACRVYAWCSSRAATWSLKSPKVPFFNTWCLMSLNLKKWSLKSLFLLSSDVQRRERQLKQQTTYKNGSINAKLHCWSTSLRSRRPIDILVWSRQWTHLKTVFNATVSIIWHWTV